MDDSRKAEQIEKLKEYESDIDEKMNYIVYEMKRLILNIMTDVLDELNETSQDQMRHQTIFTCF